MRQARVAAPYPCLWFDNHAGDAAGFYSSVFSDAEIISEGPIVVMFEILGQTIMGLNGGSKFKINPSISFFIQEKSVKEIDVIWQRLIDGGRALMPMDKYPWSNRYGWLVDKYGMTWQIMLDNSDEKASTLAPAFLFSGDHYGEAEAAMDLYTSIFDNAHIKTINRYPESDTQSGKVMFAEFSLGGSPFIAMDGPGEFTFNEALSILVQCDTQEEIDHYWNAFTEGGEESMCGWCRDRFGVWWQVVPSILGKLMSDPEKREKTIKAFSKMRKFEIAKLE